ncbi:MAG: hypothetical protein ACRDN6_06500 [Gaiellaceae bacterium]
MKRIACLLLVAALAGCGGSGDARAVFAAKANAICHRHFEQVRALKSPQSYQQLLDYVDEISQLAHQKVEELKQVQPPEGDAEEFRRMLAQMDRTLALYPELREAAVTGRPSAIRAVLRKADESDAKAGEIGRNLDLDSCVPAQN